MCVQAIRKAGGERCGHYFNLKYFHDQHTHREGFAEIARLCPSLSTVFLDTPEQGVLEELHKCDQVRKLKFNKIEYKDLLDTVSKMNHKITAIDLVSCTGNLDLGALSHLCPNINNLEIYYSKNVISKNPVKFLNLKRIVIYGTDMSGDAANDIHWEFKW